MKIFDMKNLILAFGSFLVSFIGLAQVQNPEEFLGYKLGDQFSRHHQIVDYVQHIATQSSYAQLVPYGTTYEGRKLQFVVLSAPENLNRLDEIKNAHLNSLGLTNTKAENEDLPVIVWLSYNVHGNESVSSEAALQTLHELVTEKKEWLQEAVVILDPCINPDGRDRYVNWYNQVKSAPFDSSPYAVEHFEEWPRGRYNHYYFDLNRDWAWMSQKETQQRLPHYLSWMPHVHVDFHEQGVDSPYYFAPAVAPYNEVITDFQREFQTTIGKNHARYFDQNGWLYFTDDVFDLLYPGYGDTYPMFNGAIGMTYEQGGSGRAGLSIVNSAGNLLTLKDRIAHHYTTGLSTIETAINHKKELLDQMKAYHTNKQPKFKTYAFEGHPDKIKAITKLLNQHQIETHMLTKATTIQGLHYGSLKKGKHTFPKNSLIVKGNGTKSQLIQSLLEPQTKLADSLTYDITAWSLPYAYGLSGMASKQEVSAIQWKTPSKEQPILEPAYAYAAERKSLNDGLFLGALIKAGIRVYYNEKPLTNGGKRWDEGSLFVLRGENPNIENLHEKVTAIARNTNQTVVPLRTGFSDQGPDLGANSMRLIKNKRIAILKSDAASPSRYGEIWHFFEQQFHYPLRQLKTQQLSSKSLQEIDVLILPPGYYSQLLNTENNPLNRWLKDGGRIVALGSALRYFAQNESFKLSFKEEEDNDEKTENTERIAYADQERDAIRSAIYGSIFEANVDSTHPLAAGYSNRYITLKTSATAYHLLENQGTVAYLTKNTRPLAGYTGDKALKKQENALLIGTEQIGRGSIVYFVDNPMYRSFWENGKLWLINALFF